MGGTTSVYQLPYPSPPDPADVPADMQALAQRIEAAIKPGTAAGQTPQWDATNKVWTPGTPHVPVLECGTSLIVWPGGNTQSTRTAVTHSLGVIPAAVLVTVYQLNMAGLLPETIVVDNATATGFGLYGFAATAPAASANIAVYWLAVAP